MRRFTFKADLRTAGSGPRTKLVVQDSSQVLAGESLFLSSPLRKNRQNMRSWPAYQRELRSLGLVDKVSQSFENKELAMEWLRIYGVTKKKILDAAPGFSTDDKTDSHCFFSEAGSKHLLSRLTARPNARITELSLYPKGDVTRIYYEHSTGPERDCDELYACGLTGLENDLEQFTRFPNYYLRFVLLSCEEDELVDIYRGRFLYDPERAEVVIDEDELS